MGIFSVSLVPSQYDDAIQKIREELRSMSDAGIHANTDDELTDSFYEDWKLEPLEEDPERSMTGSEQRERRRVQGPMDVFGARDIELQNADISVPLVPKHSNKIVTQLYGQTSLMSPLKHMADFRKRDHMVMFRCPLDDVERLMRQLRQMIDQVNVDVEKHTPGFRPRVLSEVQHRREQVTTQASKFSETMAKAGIEIDKRPGAVEPVDLKVKREIKVLREKQTDKKQEPELSQESLSLILTTIDQAGKGFETTPEAFASLGEESLRDIILGYLNNVYGMGAATGETFSKSGKTDIHLRVSEGVILITECKFWDGAKLYGETIEQLFGYLTWRDTVGVLVTFSRRKGLTGVIEEAKRATEGHESFKGDIKTHGETHFSSTHVHPSDEQKMIKVHHLFFDLAT